jgi:dihydrofolate reductase
MPCFIERIKYSSQYVQLQGSHLLYRCKAFFQSLKAFNMGKLSVFNFITLNGYFKGPDGDLSWHKHEGEESSYASEGLASGSILLFGRVTYEMMASWWPTPAAINSNPEIANGMNASEKVVFSRTLKKADWNNTKLVKDNLAAAIKKLKQLPDRPITVLGSGSLVTQLAELGLVDEYQLMIDPVALGEGTPIFSNIQHPLSLKLTNTRTFKSGVVLLCYEPAKK